MSTKNLQHLKNRIAPPFHKIFMVLILFLSSILSAPVLIGNSYIASFDAPSTSLMSESSLALFQEKLDVTVGKDDSVIVSLELDGGLIRTPLNLLRSELSYVSQMDFIVSNQSSFSNVWTNTLWKYPDGLVVKLTLRTQERDRIRSVIQYVNNVLQELYDITLGVYNIYNPSSSETLLFLVSPISYSQILLLFETIFKSDYQEENGNSIEIIENMLLNTPAIFAFGFSLQKKFGLITRILRNAVIAEKNKIPNIDDQRMFNLSTVLGAPLIPKPNAFISKFTFNLPFLANITKLKPHSDNIGGLFTGSFEWVLKFLNSVRFNPFDFEIIYSPFSFEEFVFPRVSVLNSYSDLLLENNGILNMTYEIKNTGTDTAYNTTIVLPIPTDLETLVNEGYEIDVLKDDLQVNEAFSSAITLDIQYLGYHYEMNILDIQGWYENTTTVSPERWLNTTDFAINEYITVETTNGISEDLYNALMTRIVPLLGLYDISDIVNNFPILEPIIFDELQQAVVEAYNVILYNFYDKKTILQFNSPNFSYRNSSLFGGYLECVIPQLEVNESFEAYWSISDIPTTADRFGFFSIFPADSNYESHTIFRTVETDYKTLILALFTSLNSAGRFLSTYDSITDSFISLGSRYQYFDSVGRDYYGITNGLNLQLGDDEAVLESQLSTDETTYRVGDIIPFNLKISNIGTTEAYNIHVDIVNLHLNYLWLPTDVIVVKSFEIDGLEIGEILNKEFSIKANSHVGLNTYVAVISFISDLDQPAEEIYIPWINSAVPWIYSGEARNIITSTLTFGILFPPVSLENLLRPSFPLPEIQVSSDYEIYEESRTMCVEYSIENIGLSTADIDVSQIISIESADIDEINCSLILESGEEQILSTKVTSKTDFHYITYANESLSPGDKILIEITLSNLAEDIIIPPLIINYDSAYQISSTNFQSTETQLSTFSQDSQDLSIKYSPVNISESEQNLFLWTSFSELFKINLPISQIYDKILFSSLPWLYPLISTGLLSGVLVIVIIVSRSRK